VPRDLASDLLDALNKLLPDRKFYDPPAWRGIDLNGETKALAERGVDSLTDDEVKRRNRLLLEAAYPAEIVSSRAELSISYLVWHITESPLSREEATPAIKGVVAVIMNFFVGTLGVLAASLVTAPIIPHTFEAGAIDLLLSKPISRSLLFLTKFAGGCVFILLNAAYFIVGLWLILGLRFDIWSGRLLLSIPIFLFLFAIYYAVSSLAGVLWRNAVVSIVVTILFWAACFVVGTTKNVMEQTWLNNNRFMKLVSAGDSLFGVTEQGQVQQWRATSETWEEAFRPKDPRFPAAVPSAATMDQPGLRFARDRLLAVETPFGGRGLAAPTGFQRCGSHRTDAWARKKPVAPAGTTELFVTGRERLPRFQGVFRLSAALFIPAGPVRHYNCNLSAFAERRHGAIASTAEHGHRARKGFDGNFSKKPIGNLRRRRSRTGIRRLHTDGRTGGRPRVASRRGDAESTTGVSRGWRLHAAICPGRSEWKVVCGAVPQSHVKDVRCESG
jgi:hypothetical protein